MQRDGDKRTDETTPEQSPSIGIGAEGTLGGNAEGPGPKPVTYVGSDGRDDVQHEPLEGERERPPGPR